jgi:hypothetical protein
MTTEMGHDGQEVTYELASFLESNLNDKYKKRKKGGYSKTRRLTHTREWPKGTMKKKGT